MLSIPHSSSNIDGEKCENISLKSIKLEKASPSVKINTKL